MATVDFHRVNKIYPNGAHAVRDLSLSIMDGELVVLVGPSGCGKSTILRMLAGLEEISRGEVLINGSRINLLSPQERNVAMVFQNYALYPHMSVRDNLEFPLKMMKTAKAEQRRRVEQVAEFLKLTEFLDLKPRHLSGGQSQRVAMGRALVRDPSVLLLDEPLSNLDAELRLQIRGEIAAIQRRTRQTTLYVTHDQVEAMTLGDRVAVLRDGVLQQASAPQELYQQPVNMFVAGFIGSPGMNIFPTIVRAAQDGRISINFGSRKLLVEPPREPAGFNQLRRYVNVPIYAGVRPEDFTCSDSVSEKNRVQIKVKAAETLGHETIIYFTLPILHTETSVPQGADRFRPDLIDTASGVSEMALRRPSSQRVETGSILTIGLETSKMYFFRPDGTTIT
ncbi:MAG: ABC transporter ATP-binding protein [Thermodesulfobacteriota bacterium]|nr:ABC transporter ATP-binding protein [Thermodesulfobacteriota bacterium]